MSIEIESVIEWHPGEEIVVVQQPEPEIEKEQ